MSNDRLFFIICDKVKNEREKATQDVIPAPYHHTVLDKELKRFKDTLHRTMVDRPLELWGF
jgi:hypothetical protein